MDIPNPTREQYESEHGAVLDYGWNIQRHNKKTETTPDLFSNRAGVPIHNKHLTTLLLFNKWSNAPPIG